jgi:hypothetical protein
MLVIKLVIVKKAGSATKRPWGRLGGFKPATACQAAGCYDKFSSFARMTAAWRFLTPSLP